MQVCASTRSLSAHSCGSQEESAPSALSPAALVVPAGQATQLWERTCSSAPQRTSEGRSDDAQPGPMTSTTSSKGGSLLSNNGATLSGEMALVVLQRLVEQQPI